MYRALLLTVLITLILPACRSRDADASDSATQTVTVTRASADTGPKAKADSGTKAGADTGMVPPTAFAKMVTQMMTSMEAHLRVMDTASAATLQTRMPRHDRMADSLISRMNEEVRRMNIATDAVWPATVDSVQQDLSRLRAMTGTGLKVEMPAHLKRMRWLIQMQQTMTGKTPP